MTIDWTLRESATRPFPYSTSEAFAFLANPAEDIYSVMDGEPFDARASFVRLRLDTK